MPAALTVIDAVAVFGPSLATTVAVTAPLLSGLIGRMPKRSSCRKAPKYPPGSLAGAAGPARTCARSGVVTVASLCVDGAASFVHVYVTVAPVGDVAAACTATV